MATGTTQSTVILVTAWLLSRMGSFADPRIAIVTVGGALGGLNGHRPRDSLLLPGVLDDGQFDRAGSGPLERLSTRTPEAVLPSGNRHWQPTMVPSTSKDVEASRVTGWPRTADGALKWASGEKFAT
ncbi:MAG TPA: hypothetical protein VFC19_50020 [Candidatus Limnocylindrales bacterium]|nr:hypothetical protein [Candidatus Limnocylindrales bacterium]